MDPGLGVFFMDLCTQEIDPSLDFDDNGDIARSGTVNNDLLQIFLQNKCVGTPDTPLCLNASLEFVTMMLVFTKLMIHCVQVLRGGSHAADRRWPGRFP